MDLVSCEKEELLNRLETLLKRLDETIKEIAPKLTIIGQMREEAALIYSELEKRGIGE